MRSLRSQQLVKVECINQYAGEEHSTPDAMDEKQVCIDDLNGVEGSFMEDSAEIDIEQQALDYVPLKSIMRSVFESEEDAFFQLDVNDFLGTDIEADNYIT